MRVPFKALRSVKLAAVLIAYLALGSAASSFAPPESRLGHFFGSPFFLVPAFLFFANLSSCAAYRLARELKKERKKRRHGPDILHLGLALLVASVVAGQVVKAGGSGTEGYARLGEGEAVKLSGGKALLVEALREEKYPDGRPKAWACEVQVYEDGKPSGQERVIRVNRPLRLGGLSVRLASFGAEADPKLPGGSEKAYCELEASYDPLYPAVLASMLLAALGIFVTFAQKLKGGLLE